MGCFRTDANNFLCNSAVLTMAWYQKFQGPTDSSVPLRGRSASLMGTIGMGFLLAMRCCAPRWNSVRPSVLASHRPVHACDHPQQKDAGVNPRVLIYLYSFVWRSQLKIDCDFRKQLGKVCRENVQRPKFQGSMILHSHFKKHKCKLLTFAGRRGLKAHSNNMLLAKTHAAFYIRVTT